MSKVSRDGENVLKAHLSKQPKREAHDEVTYSESKKCYESKVIATNNPFC